MSEVGWGTERKLVDELLSFIEATSGRKIRFSSIANLKTGETEDPQDRLAAWLKRHLADAYAAGWRDTAEAKAEGLRQAKQYVERQIKLGEYFIGGPDPNVQRRVALLEVIEYCDEQIATLLNVTAKQIEAQAQGGGHDEQVCL